VIFDSQQCVCWKVLGVGRVNGLPFNGEVVRQGHRPNNRPRKGRAPELEKGRTILGSAQRMHRRRVSTQATAFYLQQKRLQR
jgi:hypothetical protein